jgi:hypothetical protein
MTDLNTKKQQEIESSHEAETIDTFSTNDAKPLKTKPEKPYDHTLPNSLQGHEVVSTGKTIRPKRNIKQLINHGIIDIEQFDVSVDKFPYLKKEKAITIEELKYITRTLGFLPVNLVQVAFAYQKETEPARGTDEPISTADTSAAILQLYPLNTEVHKKKSVITPFPTMYWCFCPDIHAKVSILEEEGYVLILQDRLLSDPVLIETMHNAHQAYAKERWNMLSELDKEYVTQHGW